MTSRERLLKVLRGEMPDCVPVAPDFSNMIPARLTGKPFWDLYLYNDPPIWKAYIACAKHFDIDALWDGGAPLKLPDDGKPAGPEWERFIVFQNKERIVVQASYKENGKRIWRKGVDVFYVADPPTSGVDPTAIGLPPEPKDYKPLEGVKPVEGGTESFRVAKELMGDQGLVGAWLTFSSVLTNENEIYDYYDNPEKYEQLAEKRVDDVEDFVLDIRFVHGSSRWNK